MKALIHPPRSKEKVGVFATRSPHRPNPIGLTLARLIRVEDGSLLLGGTKDCLLESVGIQKLQIQDGTLDVLYFEERSFQFFVGFCF